MDITPGTDIATLKQAHAHNEGFKHWIEGMHIQFPTFKHDHPPVMDVNEAADERLTSGQRIADKVASVMGSWRFIIIQSILLAVWITANIVFVTLVVLKQLAWDPYPFIFLNLMLSFQAAYAAPFIMMSQNRQAAKDRLMAESDYHCNVKGEEEVRNIMEHLNHQDTIILEILQRLETQHEEMKQRLSQLDPEMAQRLGSDMQQMAAEQAE